jgi:hypothetical protein
MAKPIAEFTVKAMTELSAELSTELSTELINTTQLALHQK